MFAYFTLGVYLILGSLLVRLAMPEVTTFEISPSLLNHFAPVKLNTLASDEIQVPEISFKPIKENEPKRIEAKRALSKIVTFKKSLEYRVINSYTLPFGESVVLAPVYMPQITITNYATTYRNFSYSLAVTPAQEVKDEVSTKQASAEEPEFFEYEEVMEIPKAPQAKEETTLAKSEAIEESTVTVDKIDHVEKSVEEEVAVTELISFDYSKAKEELIQNQTPTISGVSSQPQSSELPKQSIHTQIKEKQTQQVSSQPKADSANSMSLLTQKPESRKYQSMLTIQVSGTDLVKTEDVLGFEVRPQDDLGETVSDYNSGSVTLSGSLSRPTMTRSVAVLKRGFVPTNTDLILEEGALEVTLPLIEEKAFNEMISPYESMGAVGALLVELGDDVETTSIDAPYSKVIHLNEEMKITSGKQYAYQLYLGVKAGNTLLSYRDNNDVLASKIVHVHDHEVTFDSNFYESEKSRIFTLVEEDLIGKEKTPLIISSENVREFAEDKTAKKVNDHTYKLETRKELLGARRYLELTHQDEPIFVGLKDSTKLVIPSESYMRYVLSKTQSGSVANRCVVQVNLAKEVSKIDIGSESVFQSLDLATHFIDSDGKFYDSPGSKTEKVVIIGENHGAAQNSQDGKVNLKIEYVDGSFEYLSSYCSPNTYLVEQL